MTPPEYHQGRGNSQILRREFHDISAVTENVFPTQHPHHHLEGLSLMTYRSGQIAWRKAVHQMHHSLSSCNVHDLVTIEMGSPLPTFTTKVKRLLLSCCKHDCKAFQVFF